MDILFVADPLEQFKIYKDTTFAMMREAARRGHTLYTCEPQHLAGRAATSRRRRAAIVRRHGPQRDAWYTAGAAPRSLKSFDAVLMRKDPPFDTEYIYAPTCSNRPSARARASSTSRRRCATIPRSSRSSSSRSSSRRRWSRATRPVRAFHAEHGDIILKPLDGMGGMGIFRVERRRPEPRLDHRDAQRDGARRSWCRSSCPRSRDGDKRILVIGGKPVPYSLARIPQGTEVRGNLAAGGKGVAQPLTERDREIAEALGAAARARGLLLIGLDVIGD